MIRACILMVLFSHCNVLIICSLSRIYHWCIKTVKVLHFLCTNTRRQHETFHVPQYVWSAKQTNTLKVQPRHRMKDAWINSFWFSNLSFQFLLFSLLQKGNASLTLHHLQPSLLSLLQWNDYIIHSLSRMFPFLSSDFGMTLKWHINKTQNLIDINSQ